MWPTATAAPQGGRHEYAKDRSHGRGGGRDLQSEATAWATPTAGDSKASGSRNVAGSKAHAGVSLTDLVTTGDSHGRAWATPTSRDWKDGDPSEKVATNSLLGRQAPRTQVLGEQSSSDGPNSHRQWPTPNAISGHQSGTMGETGGSGNPFRGTPLENAKLNPNFVDWLMGWPPGMSACEPLETGSFRSWRRVHSSLLRDVLG